MSKSILTKQEKKRLSSIEVQLSYAEKYDNLPIGFINVSKGTFKTAKKTGKQIYCGAEYIYQQESDELIRKDVLKLVMRWRKKGEGV
jgi:hypothetical protein